MKKTRLGKTELELTSIGLGTWAIGGGNWAYSWGSQNDDDSVAVIHRALELGINWIDTAPVYGLGHSEEIVGKAIKDMSERPIIASKCGLVWDEKRSVSPRLKADSIYVEVEDSLKRLQVDVIDLYQIHWPNPAHNIEEAWEAIYKLIKKGKVRYGGVCNFNVFQLSSIEPIHPVMSLQPPYSMVERGIEDDILDYCINNNIGVIAYSPMQKGLLTGKYSKERIEELAKDDHRKYDFHFKDPVLSANLEFVEKLKPIAKNNGLTLSQLAVVWTLQKKGITSAIVGARQPFQIEDTVKADDCLLLEKDISNIDILLEERKKKLLL